jgi:hypothetical protein
MGGESDVTPYLFSRDFGLRSLATLYGFTWIATGLAGALGRILMFVMPGYPREGPARPPLSRAARRAGTGDRSPAD